MNRLNSGKRSARPELAAALAGAGKSRVQLLVILTDDRRQVIREVLPLTQIFANAPARTMADGIRWLAVDVDPGARIAAKMTLQAADSADDADLASGIHLLRGGPPRPRLVTTGRHNTISPESFRPGGAFRNDVAGTGHRL